jgi:diphthamide biosynthesis enzyme Dph1/Dph2-like protein
MPKTIFIPAKVKFKLDKDKILEISKKLPKKLFIAYSIQYEDIAKKIKKILSKNHDIKGFQQVLGCSKLKLNVPILLIGSGKFHAINLALESQGKVPVYILENNFLNKISKEDIEQFEKKKKSAYLKYLHADKVGILISTKPGQNKLKQAIDFKNKKINNKKSYLFMGNIILKNEFENFPDITSWVNTACPRLDMDFGVVNMRDLIR